MKFDFICEDRDFAAYITNAVPNDTLQMNFPSKVITINGKPIKTCEEFHAAYQNAATGDHRFFMLIEHNGLKTYFNLHITETEND